MTFTSGDGLNQPAFENQTWSTPTSSQPYIDSVEQQFAAHQPAPTTTAPAPTDPFAGLTRDQIKAIQAALNAKGAHLVVDGIAGPLTRAAYSQYGPVAPTTTPAAPAPASDGGTPAPDGGSYSGGAISTPPPSPIAVEDQIRSQYGYFAAFLDIPEIGDVLRRAVTEGWDQERLQAAVQATQWWRTTASSVRSWIALSSSDPASAQAKIGTQMADIGQLAAKLGVTISPDRLRQMSEDAVKYGWDSVQLQNAIASEWHYQPGGQKGMLGQAEAQIRQMAADYLVPLSDSTLADWESQVARGTATPDTFKAYLTAQAKGMFPALAHQLDAGMTVQQLAEPYRQVAAKDLGLAPDAIDFTDPKWSRPFTQIDPKTNTPTMMGLYDWQRTIRSDSVYGFAQSATGVQMAADAALSLGKSLGVRA